MAQLAMPLMVVGSLVSAVGTIGAGMSARSAANFEAKQLESRGKAEQAAFSREAGEARRQAQIKASRAQAVSAASGGVDEGLLADIAGEGEYNVLSALYQGEEARKGRTMQAAGRRAEGRAAMTSSVFKAAGTLASAGGSLMEKYG